MQKDQAQEGSDSSENNNAEAYKATAFGDAKNTDKGTLDNNTTSAHTVHGAVHSASDTESATGNNETHAKKDSSDEPTVSSPPKQNRFKAARDQKKKSYDHDKPNSEESAVKVEKTGLERIIAEELESKVLLEQLRVAESNAKKEVNQDQTVPVTAMSDDDKDKIAGITKSVAWADICEIDCEENFRARIGSSFLERKAAVNVAVQANVFALPFDLKTNVPRIAEYFELAAKVAGSTITYSEPSVGTVMHPVMWQMDTAEAQKHLNSLNKDASRADHANVINVIDFFQSLIGTIELPCKIPSKGIYHSASIFIETYYEKEHNIPRLETRKRIHRANLRSDLLEFFKKVFVSDGSGANMLNLVEIMSQKIYVKALVKPNEVYIKKLTDQIRPAVTVIANDFYKKDTEVTIVSAEVDKRGKIIKEEKKVKRLRLLAPSVPVSEREVGSITTSDERTLLNSVNLAFQEMRSKESLLRLCNDKIINTQVDMVKAVVERQYVIASAIRTELTTRVRNIKSAGLEVARSAVYNGSAQSLAEAFTNEVWLACAGRYLEEKRQTPIKEVLSYLNITKWNPGEIFTTRTLECELVLIVTAVVTRAKEALANNASVHEF